MSVQADEFILLRLPPKSDNIVLVIQTIAVMQYIFYDKRISTKASPKNFNQDIYTTFREKCLKIENKEISFTINEFLLFSKFLDFVSKCFLGHPNQLLKEVFEEDFKEENRFSYDQLRSWYLSEATLFFDNFRKNCKNEELLKEFNRQLIWRIDI